MQYTDYPAAGIADAEKRRVKMLEAANFKSVEVMELRNDSQLSVTGYPDPKKRYYMILQSDKDNLEHIYYWMVGHAMHDFNLPYAMKVVDSTAASVSSSSFGDMQGRLNAQQQNVSNYLATIGRMIKDMFGITRELRQLNERIGYYIDAKSKKPEDLQRKDSAEKTLKGIWVDLVEGGTQNPSSVLGLSQRVGFTILPDLFFGAPPMTENDIDEKTKGMKYNDQIVNMLKRKLFQFYRWKKETYQELLNKRQYMIKYLRQHFESIRLYSAYLRPYLQNVEQLNLDEEKMTNDPWLVKSFQSQIMEMETIVYGTPIGDSHPVVSLHFHHRATPSLDFHAKEAWQNKGPIHIGRTEITIRTYVWSKKDLENYAKMRKKEDFSMLSSINSSLKDAVESMGDEIIEYLMEAGQEFPDDWIPQSVKDKQKKEEKKQESPPEYTIIQPFADMGQGIIDIFKPLIPIGFKMENPFSTSKQKMEEDEKKAKKAKNAKVAAKLADIAAWNVYKNYKKAHGHFAW